jgi:trehalose synthase
VNPRNIETVPLSEKSIDEFLTVLEDGGRTRLEGSLSSAAQLLDGRVLWNINSTAQGGGVAEMLDSLLPYMRGGQIDTRWNVVKGDGEFFAITKRIHNMLHGDCGDGGELGAAERATYEAVLEHSGAELCELAQPADVVILHDPQTAGLTAALKAHGASVVWRSHIGIDRPNEYTELAWQFLLPYLEGVDAFIFSRNAYVPEALAGRKIFIIQPSIDPHSHKNRLTSVEVAAAKVAEAGLIADASVDVRINPNGEETLLTGPPVELDGQPLVVQISRWDRLKDHLGVMQGFAEYVLPRHKAQLILAGPAASGVADDPEAAENLEQLFSAWRELPADARAQIHIACLPMDDINENAAIVNALQTRADIIIQKSLAEGFGLTVSEAMWKGKPVLASGVGGIADQIEDGLSGVLLSDPIDKAEFGEKLVALLEDPAGSQAIGAQARIRVRDNFLHDRQIAEHAELIAALLAAEPSG